MGTDNFESHTTVRQENEGRAFRKGVCRNFEKMADVSMMGESLDKCAMAFVDRTRQLKSLVLLRSSGPSEQTDQVKFRQPVFSIEPEG